MYEDTQITLTTTHYLKEALDSVGVNGEGVRGLPVKIEEFTMELESELDSTKAGEYKKEFELVVPALRPMDPMEKPNYES